MKVKKMNLNLFQADCFDIFPTIETNSIDFVIVDPPYGLTNYEWDKDLDWQKIWPHLHRICKNNAAVAVFGIEPFSSRLRLSNIKEFKYDWIWEKDKATNFLNCKKQPLRNFEIISIFYKKQCNYFPQLSKKNKKDIRPVSKRMQTNLYRNFRDTSDRTIDIDLSYPKQILKFNSNLGVKNKRFHTCEKPQDLLKFLIKTYTKDNDMILDFTMGCGSAGLASLSLNRKFIGIEKNKVFFDTAKERLKIIS